MIYGGIEIPQLKQHVVKTALDYLNLGGKQAVNMVTGTILSESYSGGVTHLKQMNNGVAVGIGQMEPATYNDIFKNFLSSSRRSDLLQRIKNIAGNFWLDSNGLPSCGNLIGNLYFSAAMTRVFYLRISKPLPNYGDAEEMAKYYKQYYNTPLGKAKIEEKIPFFQAAIDA